MADNNNTSNNINSTNQFITDYIETMALDQQGLLQSIDLTLKSIARNDGIKISQSSLKDLMVAEQRNDVVIQKRRSQRQGANGQLNRNNGTSSRYRQGSGASSDWIDFDKRSGKVRAGKMWEEVIDDFEETLLEGLTGTKNPFDDIARNLVDGLTKSLGLNNKDDLGKEIGKRILTSLDNIPYTSIFSGNKTTIGKQLREEFNWYKEKGNNILNSSMRKVTQSLGADWVDIDFFANKSKTGDAKTDAVIDDIDDLGNLINDDLNHIVNSSTQASSDLIEFLTQQFDRLDNNIDNNAQKIIDAIYNSGNSSDAVNSAIDDVIDDTTNDLKDAVKNSNNKVNPDDVVDVPFKEVASDIPDSDSVQLPEVLDNVTNVVDDIAGEGGKLISTLGKGGNTVTELIGPIQEVASGMGSLGTAIPELTAGLGMIVPLVLLELEHIATQLKEVIAPAEQSVKDFFDSIQVAALRNITANYKYNSLARKRAEQDITSIREAAFKVIEDSAQRVMEVWDNVESTIAATQEIDKAGVQDLWSAYAQRLKEEGLSKYVSSADIMEKLESVLNQGLQGAVAEEFAYQATLLNSAIPTEDFFQYASTYASIAANAIKSGLSQQEAINYATNELKSFADSLLYANREVAQGFTTSLVNSASLFEKAATIAISAHPEDITAASGVQSVANAVASEIEESSAFTRALSNALESGGFQTGSVSAISRVLTTVSGAVGAIAPDLADNVIDAIYKAAIGGNSSEITALRSMAGVGAGNTAFLQAFSANPMQVLSTLFTNLSQLQSMSSSNYMEVAEALSSVFGMSMESFTRVDFAYLADAINNMSTVVGDDLSDNMQRLADGQTTSNDAQMRMQKINEYMIEEGLAYVLDNDVARSIQEHMWEEQLNRDLIEAQYSVDLVGSSQEMLANILVAIKGIVEVLSPVGWIQQFANVSLTALEGAAQSADLEQILELGKVGEGNAQELYNLTNYGENLRLATPIVELLGGRSELSRVQDLLDINDAIAGILSGTGSISDLTDSVQHLAGGEDGLLQGIQDVVSGAASTATDWLDNLSNKVKGWWDSTTSSLSKAASDTTSKVKSTVGAIGDAVSDAIDSFGNTVKNTTGAVAEFFDMSSVTSMSQVHAAEMSTAANTIEPSVTKLTNTSQNLNKSTQALTKATEDLKKNAGDYGTSARNIVGKAVSSLINSGDWRTNSSFNALYQNYGASGTSSAAPTQTDAQTLATKITASIQDYVKNSRDLSTSLDNVRNELHDNSEDRLTQGFIETLEQTGYVLHRDFYTNQEMVDQVLQKADEIAAEDATVSFEAWLTKFERDTGIENLPALLSDFGESISTIQAAYTQEENARQNAITKARELHEVQFWEDMQHFATIDFPFYLREWERYYIQHEAYTDATNDAYAEAVSLSVKEKGEIGDSVLALAEALTENNLWMQDLGDELKDPQVHANTLLAKILLCVEAIMQQTNETSIVSVPTALSSLGLGISNV